jgi:hypothetical protein
VDEGDLARVDGGISYGLDVGDDGGLVQFLGGRFQRLLWLSWRLVFFFEFHNDVFPVGSAHLLQVLRSSLQAVEQERAAAGVDDVVAERAQDFEDGELDGVRVFEKRKIERGATEFEAAALIGVPGNRQQGSGACAGHGALGASGGSVVVVAKARAAERGRSALLAGGTNVLAAGNFDRDHSEVLTFVIWHAACAAPHPCG